MKQYPASKTQTRALASLGLETPRGYDDAAALLEANGFDRSGAIQHFVATTVVTEVAAKVVVRETLQERHAKNMARKAAKREYSAIDEEDADHAAFARAGY